MEFDIEMTQRDLNSDIGKKLLYYLIKNEGEYDAGDYYFDVFLEERGIENVGNTDKYKVLRLKSR